MGVALYLVRFFQFERTSLGSDLSFYPF